MSAKQIALLGSISNDQSLEIENRKSFDAAGVFAINLIGSPGSGKTHLILRTIQALSGHAQIGVVEAETTSATLDSEHVMATGVPVTTVKTVGSGGVEATMLSRAMDSLPLDRLDLLLVENIGSLILPAPPKLGTHANVLVASVPEGEDKPYKYPGIYSCADVVILNKTDLLPVVPFDLGYFRQGVQKANPEVLIFPLSAYTGADVHRWFDWIFERCGVLSKPLSLRQRA